METEKLIYLLKQPNLTQVEDVSALQSVASKYPYFQAPRALQLKALKDSGSFAYNHKLKETAAYTTDREVLFDFITSEKFNLKVSTVKELPLSEVEEVVDDSVNATIEMTIEEASKINNESLFESLDKEKQPQETIVEPSAPLEFSKEETHCFTEWLKLSTVKQIVREEEKKPKKQKLIESSLIEKFIKNNPKIKPVKKSTQAANVVIHESVSSEDLMTETLAKVYLAQGNYKKAIQAYKILSLKNPEKSGLFADQIRAIKKLQDNNK